MLFSDLTSEGDPSWIKSILDTRLGLKIQLARINPDLERLSKTDAPLILAELQRARRMAESLPIEKEGMSEGLEYGLRDGRSLALYYISNMETDLGKEKAEAFSKGRQAAPLDEMSIEKFKKTSMRAESYLKCLERRL